MDAISLLQQFRYMSGLKRVTHLSAGSVPAHRALDAISFITSPDVNRF